MNSPNTEAAVVLATAAAAAASAIAENVGLSMGLAEGAEAAAEVLAGALDRRHPAPSLARCELQSLARLTTFSLRAIALKRLQRLSTSWRGRLAICSEGQKAPITVVPLPAGGGGVTCMF